MTHFVNAAAVLFVADVPRMRDFYCALGPFAITSEDTQHAVLSLSGFELVIHAMRGATVEADASSPPPAREDSYIKICIPVASIAEARKTVKRLRGRLKDAKHEWAARGFRACDGVDPEGNVFQVREAESE
ncbi:MAG: hypothetical protein ACK5OB_10160 [Pirellula sp.]